LGSNTGDFDARQTEAGPAVSLPRSPDAASRFPFLVLMALAIAAVHVLARVSAICTSANYDSLTYAVAAWRFYSPDALAADLVADKPAGQALLTGWCYRLWPGSPSRLALIPIESAFLLAGYVAFWHLARRLHGTRAASLQVAMLVLAFNAYNTLDDSTAGFNVNENYLLLPTLVAVLAHLAMPDGRRRALLRGLGLGLALSVKQTAVGLLVAFLIHGAIRACRSGPRRETVCSAAWTGAGLLLAVSPLVVVLAARDWLAPHLYGLAHLSAEHLEPPRPMLPPWIRIVPLVPIAWWLLVGAAARWGERSAGRSEQTGSSPESTGRSDAGSFLWIWLTMEVAVLAMLNRHSAHYYQPLVVPAALLTGTGLAWVVRSARSLPPVQRARVVRWSVLVTFALAMPTVMSFAVEFQRRWVGYDITREAGEFARRLADGSP